MRKGWRNVRMLCRLAIVREQEKAGLLQLSSPSPELKVSTSLSALEYIPKENNFKLPCFQISEMPRCTNCTIFLWNQPDDPKTVRKCSKCHMVSYCGKECQEEHWTKVHKKQCRYLAGTKKAEHSEHRRDTCRTCIASNSAGDLAFSQTNPNYVCIFESVDRNI